MPEPVLSFTVGKNYVQLLTIVSNQPINQLVQRQ